MGVGTSENTNKDVGESLSAYVNVGGSAAQDV